MEINLQFDDNGRTRCQLKEGVSLDYEPKTVMTSLMSANNNTHAHLDDLLLDCEIADCALMPRTFWMPTTTTTPSCALEQMALDVFHRHVPRDCGYDPATSGAEWWVQIRPSPEGVGRYSVLLGADDDDDMVKTGISFHWDKDEDLRILAGGNLYVHPHISTVTYLTGIGAPTMTCNRRINALTGEWVEPGETTTAEEACISWPRQGKHLSFDGGYLHAAPSDLMKEGDFEAQIRIPEGGDDKTRKVLTRRHRRVTFLVNVWLNYKPVNVNRFPESMMSKLSKVKDGWHLFDDDPSTISATQVTIDKDNQATTTTSYKWPMGGCDSTENITALIPLEKVREKAPEGGSVRLKWSTESGMTLSKGEPEKRKPEDDKDDEGSSKRPKSS